MAPASTGDTSLLEHPQPGVRELVLGTLSASDKRLLLEGGTPRHSSDMAPVGRPRSPRSDDLAAVCSEQAVVCPVNGARCESIACVDVGCTAADADVDAGRAA